MTYMKRDLRLLAYISVAMTMLSVSDSSPACIEQPWCSLFPNFCSTDDITEEMKKLCPITCGYCDLTEGGFTPWSNWTECSSECGLGFQSRTRKCDGAKCQTDKFGDEVVQKRKCYKKCGRWGGWMPWTECSATCGQGTQKKTRKCTDGPCRGKGEVTRRCNNIECPRWSEWSEWSACSRTCGEGAKRRFRKCMNGVAGVDCDGDILEEMTCVVKGACPRVLTFGCSDSSPYCQHYGHLWCSNGYFAQECAKYCGKC